MAKIYSKNSLVAKAKGPKKEVISFLLNYSKALHVFTLEHKTYEINAN
ncbi:hypothetical protein HNQ02_001072 [Flavobacterium sp. 7E]|nr:MULTISPECIES: hypothetical protein [unclassified Flavobacterium]MBE0391360.1 hypothetical protein [Flavobacterium sp. PL002]NRS88158.1 hypothetical protein [Flavobacterium sp. 7E]